MEKPLLESHRSRIAASGVTACLAAALAIAAAGLWLLSADVAAHAAPIESQPLPPAETDPTAEIDPSDLSDKDFPELEEAKKKLQTGDVKGTLAILEEASAKHSVLPPPRVMLGRMLFAANQTVAAISTLEQAIMDATGDPDPYLTLADFAISQRRFTEAGLLFEKAGALAAQFAGDETRKKNMHVRVQAGLASVAEAHQHWAIARQHLETWLELEPERAAARHRLGRVLFGLALEEEDREKKKETHDAAVEALKNAAAADETLPAAAVTMGVLYERAGKRDLAKKWMDYGAQLAPDDLRTRLGIAGWYWQINQPADAEPHALAALKLDEQSMNAKLLCGLVAHALKKWDDAEGFFRSANKQSPSRFDAMNQLALVLADQDNQAKRREALELAQMNARLNERRADALATLGWVLYLNGRSQDAARSLNAAASGGKVSSETAYYLARFSADQGKTDDAVKFLEKALAESAPFIHRSDAQELHAKLASAADSSEGGSSPPVTTTP